MPSTVPYGHLSKGMVKGYWHTPACNSAFQERGIQHLKRIVSKFSTLGLLKGEYLPNEVEAVSTL
jgi:hypothetical protein